MTSNPASFKSLAWLRLVPVPVRGRLLGVANESGVELRVLVGLWWVLGCRYLVRSDLLDSLGGRGLTGLVGWVLGRAGFAYGATWAVCSTCGRRATVGAAGRFDAHYAPHYPHRCSGSYSRFFPGLLAELEVEGALRRRSWTSGARAFVGVVCWVVTGRRRWLDF